MRSSDAKICLSEFPKLNGGGPVPYSLDLRVLQLDLPRKHSLILTAVDLHFSFEWDRFLGGDAGRQCSVILEMHEKRLVTKRVGVRTDYRFSKTATFSSGVGVEFLGQDERLNRLESNLSFKLKKGVALSLDSSACL